MKTFQSNKAVPRIAALSALVASGLLLVPTVASANTAADTTIRNTVYVDYADASAVAQPQISAEVDVVVQLVAAAPTLNAPVDQTIAPSSTATYSYTVFSNANGPDIYDLTTPLVESGGLSGSTAGPSVASVTLGATTAVAGVSITLNTPTPITVPSDATADLSVNGISAALSDVVVINGVRCDVTAINDLGTPGTGAIANSSITVDCDANVTVTTGMVIGEQRSFTVTVDPNGFTPPGPETVTVTTTAEVQGTPALNDTDDTITTVEQLLTVTKYVRNVDTNAAGTGVPVLVDGNTYYPADVVGIPGETLEYLVLVENTSASNNATDTVISDPIPAFTTFNATNFAVINNAGVATAADPVADQGTDEGELVGNTVYLYPGSTTHGDDAASGGGNPNGDGGTIAAGEVAYGRFQVDID